MSLHLGGVSTYPCFIFDIVSKWDQTNDIYLFKCVIHLSSIHLERFDCILTYFLTFPVICVCISDAPLMLH